MPDDSPHPNELSVSDLTAAINLIDDFSALGRTPLAQADIVSVETARPGTSDTAFHRGRLLSDLIRREVTRRAEQSRRAGGPHAIEWTILHLRVNEERSLAEIATALGMPQRTVGRYYRRAKELLLDRLLSIHGSQQPALFSPACGTRVANTIPETPTERICSGCGRKLYTTPDEGDLMVRVTRVRQG